MYVRVESYTNNKIYQQIVYRTVSYIYNSNILLVHLSIHIFNLIENRVKILNFIIVSFFKQNCC